MKFLIKMEVFFRETHGMIDCTTKGAVPDKSPYESYGIMVALKSLVNMLLSKMNQAVS